MNSIAQAVYNWEKSISDKYFLQKEKERISQLTTKQEVIDYYLNERGWVGNTELITYLLYFVITLP